MASFGRSRLAIAHGHGPQERLLLAMPPPPPAAAAPLPPIPATKYIQKIPKNVLDKPKMGFGVPIKDWLRDELSDWANDLLSSSSLSKTSIFHKNSVDNLWHQHV